MKARIQKSFQPRLVPEGVETGLCIGCGPCEAIGPDRWAMWTDAARLRGQTLAGRPVFAHKGLRLEELDTHDVGEEEGAAHRARSGRFEHEVGSP